MINETDDATNAQGMNGNKYVSKHSKYSDAISREYVHTHFVTVNLKLY